MNALNIVIDSWGKKDVAELACEKIIAAEAAATELEKAQAALAAAQDVAEKAKAEAEKAVHNLPPLEQAAVVVEESTTVSSPAATVVESEDERIARIVAETLVSLGVVPQAGVKEAQVTAPSTPTQMTVEKSAVELTLSPAPVAGPTGAKGGNYPVGKQQKQRR